MRTFVAVLERSAPSALSEWAPVVLRLIVGYGFIVHGVAKLSRGPDAFAGVLHALGTPAPNAAAWLTIAVELLGGAAVLAGAYVRLTSIPLIAVLAVAIVTVHLRFGFSSIKLLAVTPAGPQFGPPGYETALLYVFCLLALMLTGPGPVSVDRLLTRARLRPRRVE